MNGDLEGLVTDQVLQARAVTGRVGEADHGRLVRVESLGQYGGQVATRVAVGVLDLEPEPDAAVLAHECWGCGGQERAQLDNAIDTDESQRRCGGRDELPQ